MLRYFLCVFSCAGESSQRGNTYEETSAYRSLLHTVAICRVSGKSLPLWMGVVI